MGIFDFFKKVAEGKKSEGVKGEKIAFPEIKNWIEAKNKDLETNERKIIVSIKNLINLFINELERKINVVKDVDINQRKVEERFKFAAEEGRSKYLEAVSSLIINLGNLSEDKPERFISKIDSLFLYFNKHSHMSYERATILIGKEMGGIKNEIKVFSRELIKVFGENKDIVDLSGTVSIIELKLKQIEEVQKDDNRINEKIIYLDKEIFNKENDSKIILEEIEKIKKSQEYLDYIKNMKEGEFIKEDIKKDFIDLTRFIDFKALGNFYHIFEDKIEIVKSYRNEFQKSFQVDDGREILNLLNIAKLNTEGISNKINEINDKREILKNKTEETVDKTQELFSKIKKITLEIDEIKNLKTREEKRLEKSKISRGGIVSEIKQEFEKLGIDLYPS